MSCPSAWLLNAVHFAHYYIPLLSSDSLEWKLSSQLLPDEYRSRLTRHAPGCSVPPSNIQQPYVASMSAVNHWSKARQPKCSRVFGFCHLFWCFPSSVPFLGQGSVQDLSEKRQIQNGSYSKLLYSLCPWPQGTPQYAGERLKRNAENTF